MGNIRDLVIIGAGDFGREVAALVSNINESEQQWNLRGFVDDGLKGKTFEGIPIIGNVESLYNMKPKPFVVIAIASTRVKKSIAEELKQNNIPLAVLVHPSVIISDHVDLGEGSIISAGTIFAINTKVGEHCILNLGCRVGHDTVIGTYSSCMPGTNLAGKVIVGEGCYFGLNACVINGLEIGEWSTIGAGASVIKNIPPNSLAVGVPAKVIKNLSIK